MSTFDSRLSPYKSTDVDTQALVNRRAGETVQWHIHWYTPAITVALFVGGFMGAVAHHLFYKHLNGRPAENQLLMIRYGTALAFFTKATLVGTVILCYRQRIWHTFRKKAMTISAIDGLFAATEDPTSFRIGEMIKNAKLATLMALCSWLIPIASVLSPASLTSDMMTSSVSTHCPNVATLDFGREAVNNFRLDTDFPGSTLLYYNTTDINATTPGWFDYYDQPSKFMRRLAIIVVYLKEPRQYANASVEACGSGWNCTYSISFQAPGYKCEEVASSEHPNTDEIVAQGAPFNISLIAPEGDYVYYANVDLGDYEDPQVDTGRDGMPVHKGSFPDLLGVFQSEPVLWIGYAINTSQPYEPTSKKFKQWRNVHEAKIMKCVAHHTEYTFELNYTDGIQYTRRKQRNFLKPLVDTNITITSENHNKSTASPSSNYIRPNTDVPLYKRTAAYHAMGALFRNFLRGDISKGPDSPSPVTRSDISETRLVIPKTAYPVQDLQEQVQLMFEDMIITLLSERHLIVSTNISVPCSKSRTVNVYVYYPEGLWIGYAIVITVALLSMIIGAWSIFQNGVTSDTHFSRIMVTTRNPTIDRLSVGACLGGDPFPTDLKRAKLRFGVLVEDEPKEGQFGVLEHCTFGTVGETKDIVKYGKYAGLRRWSKGLNGEVGDRDEEKGMLEEAEEDAAVH
ncbi:hypothetical protein GQ43DRAFT_364113 [Delitschia confertaspora ATCC 74209]|uniref:Uncharacterized protein n=1 Tax=Delitschia confertaspora ATCC 74209 TaxID=1513339 RepID=A0A9P4JY78_9PLEO|nr:hypothetical protein GQ43DRAFT_364113 [Delitschia confertaspora ATCC 74209]